MDSAQLQSVQVVEVVVAELLVREELLLLARLLLRALDLRRLPLVDEVGAVVRRQVRRVVGGVALELEQRRAANACEAGPRRLATSPHFGWGASMIFMGGVAGGSTIVPRRAGGLGTHNLSSPRRKIADTTP